MPNLLVYSDSQSWGLQPGTGLSGSPKRHSSKDQWPTVLENELGDGFSVVNESLCGRTTVFDDFLAAENRNGASILPILLGTHAPFNPVVILLGVNDLKREISGSAITVMRGLARLVEIVRCVPYSSEHGRPKVMIVSPPPLVRTDNPYFNGIFGPAIDEFRRLPRLYRELAQRLDCFFFEGGSVVETSVVDGVQLDSENLRHLGVSIAPVIRKIFKMS